MARWFLLALMFLLPTQFIWAAAATYCEHESKPVTFHVGHHVHQHQAASTDSGLQDADELIRPIFLEHDDCTYCQTGVGQFGVVQEAIWVVTQGCSFAGAAPEPYNFRVEEDIDRPKWTRAG